MAAVKKKGAYRTAVPDPVIDPELNRGGAPRASSGFSMALFTPELAHQRLDRVGPHDY